ncbi:hypothetical protein GW915_05090 [bacterium]|nr:hypothetical protein [bacterium]
MKANKTVLSQLALFGIFSFTLQACLQSKTGSGTTGGTANSATSPSNSNGSPSSSTEPGTSPEIPDQPSNGNDASGGTNNVPGGTSGNGTSQNTNPEAFAESYLAQGAHSEGIDGLADATKFQTVSNLRVQCSPWSTKRLGFNFFQGQTLPISHLSPSVKDTDLKDPTKQIESTLVQVGSTSKLSMQYLRDLSIYLPTRKNESLSIEINKSFYGKFTQAGKGGRSKVYSLWSANAGSPSPVLETSKKYYTPKLHRVETQGQTKEQNVGAPVYGMLIRIDSTKAINKQPLASFFYVRTIAGTTSYLGRCAYVSSP